MAMATTKWVITARKVAYAADRMMEVLEMERHTGYDETRRKEAEDNLRVMLEEFTVDDGDEGVDCGIPLH